MPVVLEFLFSRLEPLLEPGRFKDRRNQRCGDLVCRGLSSMIRNDGADEPHGILGGLLENCRCIGGGAGQNMLRGNVGQCLGSVLQQHRMPFLGNEINCDLTGDELPSGDPSEPPAAVHAKSTWGEVGK